VTSGIISAKGRGPGIAEREDFLQTDAAINPGNSGGPLLNLHGDVIGVNTAISSRSGGFDGIGFAVPSRMAWWVVNQLVEKGRVTRAYIGISIQQISNDLANQLGVKVGEGAIVTQVLPESPGAKASLTPGDVVLSLNGSQVTSPRSLQGIVEKLELDKEYTVEILRNGDRARLPIVLQEMPNDYTLARVMGRRPRERREELKDRVTVEDFGFEIRELTPEIAEQLGVEAGSGVVVSSVDTEGKASGKLRTGDVIEKIGDEAIGDTAEFNAALSKADLKKGLLLLVRTGDATRFEVLR
jgi:serine protease Do